MSRKIIDLSVWNCGSKINWEILKDNIDGMIIRIGYRGYGNSGSLNTDPRFRDYADNCVKYNIPFGVYWFAQEINEKESKESAQYIANILKDYKLSYPVYYDVEYSGAKNNAGRADYLNKDKRTDCIIAFCNEIKNLGYESGVYASDDWYINKINYDKIKKYSIWCAKWNSDSGEPEVPPTFQHDIWQYTSKGNISGITGRVDISIEMSALIDNDDSEKSINDIALEVIAGKWGNYPERKEALINMGYNYELVQEKVNEILDSKYAEITLKQGDKVKLKYNAVYTNNVAIPQWVQDSILYVRRIEKTTGNVVVSTLKTGNITGVVNKKYLMKL